MARSSAPIWIAVAGIAVVAALFVLVTLQGPSEFDRTVLLTFRQSGQTTQAIGGPRLVGAVRDVTALGSATVLYLLCAGAALYLILRRHQRWAVYLVVTGLTGQILSTVIKQVAHRPRPDVVAQFADETSHSFPSGHAFMTAAIFLTLAVIISCLVGGQRVRLFAFGVAILLSALVGLSRLYLGVHWPTDVLAGWAGGASWAMICWIIARGWTAHRA